VETFVTSDYKDSAHQLFRCDLRAFVSDLNHMEHPPGYPILLAGIFTVFGDSDPAIQIVQMICDSAAAVVVFLIVFELLPVGVASTAGLLAALSPQFAYYSVLLLPDSLAVLPILLAIYFLIRARKRPRLLTFATAGAFVGLSCCLRANALLLAPFLSVFVLILFERGKRLQYSAILILGTLILIAPITVKNLIVFHHFVPLSLGAGQKLLEGIAEYDTEGRFGIPKTDLGIMRQEAVVYERPDYALSLFGPDGIQRDRMRLTRGLAVIRSHPVWYFGVMFRRGISFFRLARVPIISRESPVTHVLENTDKIPTVWVNSPAELIANGSVVSKQAQGSLVDDGRMLRIVGDETKHGNQIVSPAIVVERNRDYVFHLPLKLEDGRAIIKVTDVDQSRVLAATEIDLLEGVSASAQPLNRLAIPFVSGNISQVRLIFANNASSPVRPVALMGQIEMFELGPSSHQWMRYPRLLIRNLQKFFITAWMLPFAIIGIALLIGAHRLRAVALLLIVPVYYLLVQSALHTERRYVIAIQYFLLILAAVTLGLLFSLLKQGAFALWLRFRRPSPARG
jgi:dolichyl-phosphate-mannose-protein mannosyltransferase